MFTWEVKCLTENKFSQLYRFYACILVKLLQLGVTLMKMPDVPQLNVNTGSNSYKGAEHA